jgi:hypothetical protein
MLHFSVHCRPGCNKIRVVLQLQGASVALFSALSSLLQCHQYKPCIFMAGQ